MIETVTVIIIATAVGYIGYAIGRQHGFSAGQEHELDKAAKRMERLRRFSERQRI